MFSTIFHTHMERYPEMQIQDIYKLAHQAAMGSGHAISDTATAAAWLDRELKEMGAGPIEPLIDPISPDGEIVRIHLRPFLSSGGDSKKLLDAFIRTGNEFYGKEDDLEALWDSATRSHFLPATDMDTFISQMKERAYPALHHSEQYNQLYKPAYRVVSRKYFSYQ